MISRRNFFAGTCAICAFPRLARGETPYHGCTSTNFRIDHKIAPSQDQGYLELLANQTGKFGSGDPTFGQALAVTLLKISQMFFVIPGFAFSDLVNLNAFASANTALGRRMEALYLEGPSFVLPEIGIAAVCAHEFGHIVQYKNRIDKILVVNGRVKRLELNADFMAGYFAGRRKLENPDFPAAVFAATQYTFGDSDYGSLEHHGTSAERGQAVVAGFDSAYRARENLATALNTGVRYAQQMPL